ncbi:MAG: preprotein translocase subunit SecE [Bdellovibrio sp.]|nr:MAG: preprotein translocase subunit SecE [Bdellovibrio sp.]
MDRQTKKKTLTLSIIATSFIAALVVSIILESLAAAFGWVAKYYVLDIVKHGVPVGVGFIVFFILQFHPKVQAWGDEVITEVSKVVWPSMKETRIMTITCCVMLLISGAILFFFDSISTALVKMILT